MNAKVLIKGAGDIATGVAYRLYRCGYEVLMTETEQPSVIRRTVAFAEAVYEGSHAVEGVTARLAGGISEAEAILDREEIPVIVDPAADCIHQLQPDVVVDAVIAKHNTGTRISDALLVIGLGPGFEAGVDVHAVVETMRGHNMGRVILHGHAEPNTGVPGEIGGFAKERLIKAPADGPFDPAASIGDLVRAGDAVGYVGSVPVRVSIAGLLRGLIRGGFQVTLNQKIGDVDPRGKVEYCYTISDKARSISGGVLEAILALLHPAKQRSRLHDQCVVLMEESACGRRS
jgi:xanthine dehydrogenase accessory factor